MEYYCDSKLTSKTKKNGWLHTKDLAYISKDGLLYIKGRKDNMIIRSGMNIYPQEIENALLVDKRVDDALVYGIQDKDITKIGLKIKGDFENISEVKELCINLLSQYQIPNIIEIVDEMPKNVSGKKSENKHKSNCCNGNCIKIDLTILLIKPTNLFGFQNYGIPIGANRLLF